MSHLFSRKKPPQLSNLEELQQTYDDCCNLSIKYITLEEQQKIEDALKGWKSLHTSLLFKIEVFEKQAYKYNNNELSILSELKGIRDENIRHLIRVQMRVDESNRKRAAQPTIALPPQSNNMRPATKSTSSSMSVPSLRNNAQRSSMNTTSTNRPMLKSLRPSSGSSSGLSKANSNHASQAASVSWPKPPAKVESVNPKATRSSDSLFEDFDQNSVDVGNNWERINHNDDSRTSSSLSAISTEYEPNLIDLDVPGPNNAEDEYHYQNNNDVLQDYFRQDHDEPHSTLEDLTLQNAPPPPKVAPPPPPPPRIRVNHSSTGNIINKVSTSGNYVSKSYSDVSQAASTLQPSPPQLHPSASQSASNISNLNSTPLQAATIVTQNQSQSQPKTYIYNKPKPMNINALMKNTSKAKPKTTTTTTTTTATTTQAKPRAKVQPKLKPASNISYNYVKPGQQKNPSPTRKPVKQAVKNRSPRSSITGTTTNGASKEPSPKEDSPPKELTLEEEEDLFIQNIKGIDQVAAKQILNDIVVKGDEVYWDDVVGLESAKNSLKEAVVYPFLRPDLFKGLREPTRGMLLFGPPGTGKTMLARAVATESRSTFFSISASSLTSKYLGESEKLVKALFLLARKLAPSIVFVDEIDSLLSSRTEGEVESSRRIKNEFLVQWSELSSAAAGRESEDVSRVLILGATNLPWSIDEAARRRFVRRQYIPLPEDETRKTQIIKLLKYQNNTLSDEDFDELIELTQGFSGSDITALAKDSAMGPLRSLGDALLSTATENIRPINLDDFKNSLKYIRPSVSSEGLEQYENWAVKFGSSGA